jgi:hypothetical protein
MSIVRWMILREVYLWNWWQCRIVFGAGWFCLFWRVCEFFLQKLWVDLMWRKLIKRHFLLHGKEIGCCMVSEYILENNCRLNFKQRPLARFFKTVFAPRVVNSKTREKLIKYREMAVLVWCNISVSASAKEAVNLFLNWSHILLRTCDKTSDKKKIWILKSRIAKFAENPLFLRVAITKCSLCSKIIINREVNKLPRAIRKSNRILWKISEKFLKIVEIQLQQKQKNIRESQKYVRNQTQCSPSCDFVFCERSRKKKGKSESNHQFFRT